VLCDALFMEKPMIEKMTLTIRDTIAATGIGRTKLYALISAGELTPIKIGTRTLLRRTDLEALLTRSAVA
jgi:excisionase family DNA binding protein